MSIKRQLKFKYAGLINSLQTISLPTWMTSATARLGVLSIIFIFGVAYVVSITSMANSGYQTNKLQKQTVSLENEVQQLQVQIADNSSINSISSRVAKLNMVEADTFTYLKTQNGLVARN